ncbi:MAG: GNAT family N-acetyltransferase [Bacteroidales bacterium]|jgi:predicted GNAT family N-acyltransferase|nr:GNAT family N-acetyltransferase [Bacteroidales bacterium]
MEIRFATQQDIVPAKKLMQDAFHDSDRFINLFFNYFLNNNLLLGFNDQEVVSMAFLLPATFTINQNKISATYLYACATAENEQGKGWMGALINRAWEESNRKGEVGLFLLPANKRLYEYYAKLGFHDFFYYDRQVFHFNKLSSSYQHGFKLNRINADQYALLRIALLQSDNAIHYPTKHFRFIEEENEKPNTGFYLIQQEGHSGLSYIIQGHNHIIVKELIGHIDISSFSEYLFYRYEIPDITINMPGETHRSAMLRPVDGYSFLTRVKGYFCWGLE